MSGSDDQGAQGGSLLLNQPIIIDNGSSSIKAGFAGSSKPKVRGFGGTACTSRRTCCLVGAVSFCMCTLTQRIDPSLSKVVLATKIGRSKHMRIMPGGALEQEASSVYVGQKLDEHRGAFLLEYPMDRGAVLENGWDAMEALWEVSDVFC
jgi:centractin